MSSKPLVGVIVGASRQGRLSEVPAHWIYQLAARRQDLRVELIDVGNQPLPFFASAGPGQTACEPRTAMASRWCAAFERLDGFIVVLPEDDMPCAECDAMPPARAFLHKPVSFVGYGARCDTARLDALRARASGLRMAPMRRDVRLTISEVMSVWQMGSGFDDYPHLVPAAHAMLEELAWWTHAMRAAHGRAGAAGCAEALPPRKATHAALGSIGQWLRAWRRHVRGASADVRAASAGQALPSPR